MLKFAENVNNYVQKVQFSVIKETLSADELEECKRISEKAGVTLRVRDYIPPQSE